MSDSERTTGRQRRLPATAIALLGRAREAAADLRLVRMLEKLAELSWESELETEVALMFSDIVDSTATAARLGDKRWMATLRTHNSLVRREIRRHRGYEVKTQGDGFMVAFSAPDRALRAAMAIQLELVENPIKEPIEVRIGLHTGAALTEAGDFFGSAVNLAARVAGKAEAGEILVSGELMDLVGDDFRFGNDRHAELKGFSGEQRIAELIWVAEVSPG